MTVWSCQNCGGQIGRRRMHLGHRGSAAGPFCARCANWDGPRIHAELFPDCPATWHDAYDHEPVLCLSRADWSVWREMEARTA